MAIIRQNSVSGINSVTAQNSTLGFYDSAGNTLTIDANVTGNVTGNLTGDVTANQITVGDTFLKSQSVGLGATTNSGRNAGINTAIGTLIYNSTTGNVEVYDGTRWKSSSVDGQYIQATGGTSVDYFSDGVKYRVHTFTSSDTFDVSYVSPLNNTVEYLVVGAGGGGGHSNIDGTQSSGGGAGGFRTGIGFVVNSSPGSYTVTIGAGGGTQSSGTNSVFDTITSLGGGGGGNGGGGYGGTGGSAGGQGGSGGSFTRNITAGTPGQGNPGGHGTGPGGDAGGGGGAAGCWWKCRWSNCWYWWSRSLFINYWIFCWLCWWWG